MQHTGSILLHLRNNSFKGEVHFKTIFADSDVEYVEYAQSSKTAKLLAF